MKTILDTIVAHKKKEVERLRKEKPIGELEKSPLFDRTPYSLREFLLNPEKSGIIAEFKRKSPSKDAINLTAEVKEVTRSYADHGASGLSVLTDSQFFGGGAKDLQQAREVNQIPILRKDFVIDEYQIIEAKALGADVILLIAECLTAAAIKHFTQVAQSLQLEVLVELHSAGQLGKIGTDNKLVGINNRDLTTFHVDIDRSIELADQLPQETVKIAESGINQPEVVIKMRKAGFQGFLMGEHFMKHQDPGLAFRKFAAAIRPS